MQLDLEVFSKETCPPYIALSYMWGSYEDTVSITVNRATLNITRNLWDFVQILHARGKTHDAQYFWADQVCMNQQDIAERDHQVGLMGAIFSGAQCVYAYLGPEPDLHSIRADSRLLGSVGTIRECGSQFGAKEDDQLLIWLEIATRPYWQRLWIVQEIWLAQSVLFWCGAYDIASNTVRSRIRWLEDSKYVLSRFIPGLETTRRTSYIQQTHTLAKYDAVSRVPFLLSTTYIGQLTPEAVLKAHGACECTDPRDKIFGLQALLRPHCRIAVDYSKSFRRIILEITRKLVLEKSSVRLLFSITSLDFQQLCSVISKLLTGASSNRSCYSKDIAGMVWDVWVQEIAWLSRNTGQPVSLWEAEVLSNKLRNQAVTKEQEVLAKAFASKLSWQSLLSNEEFVKLYALVKLGHRAGCLIEVPAQMFRSAFSTAFIYTLSCIPGDFLDPFEMHASESAKEQGCIGRNDNCSP